MLSDGLAATRPMNRLLQGEVGSGKTIVAVLAMLQMVDAGYQCALLAPTEVLAAQHVRSISDVLGPLAMGGQLGGADNATRVALLTGSMSAGAEEASPRRDRRRPGRHRHRHPRAAAGRGRIPQARHGGGRRATPVRCRAARPVARQGPCRHHAAPAGDDGHADTAHGGADRLRRPGNLDAARTSARTSADHHQRRSSSRTSPHGWTGPGSASSRRSPPGGRPTWWRRGSTRPTAAARARKADGPRRQPKGFSHGCGRDELAGLRLGLMHGRLTADEKDAVMAAFRAGEIDVLVCTTVIEVGVDVPNATVMLVMDADRFGISQLHQLRGRIGRGAASEPVSAGQLGRAGLPGRPATECGRRDPGRVRAGRPGSQGAPGRRCAGPQPVRPCDHAAAAVAGRPPGTSSRPPGTSASRPTPDAEPAPRIGRCWQHDSPTPTASNTWTSHEPQECCCGCRRSRCSRCWSPIRRGRSSAARARPGVRRARRRSDRATRHRRAGRNRGGADQRVHRYDYRRPAFGDAWTDDNDAPAGTTDATPATTSSTAISSTRRTCRSNAARTPWPPAPCTTRTPTPPSTFSAAPRSAKRCRSTTSSRWPTPGTWAPTAGRIAERVRFANDPANLLAVRVRPIRTRAIPAGPVDAAEQRVRVPVRHAVHRGVCAATRCRWTRRRANVLRQAAAHLPDRIAS